LLEIKGVFHKWNKGRNYFRQNDTEKDNWRGFGMNRESGLNFDIFIPKERVASLHIDGFNLQWIFIANSILPPRRTWILITCRSRYICHVVKPTNIFIKHLTSSSGFILRSFHHQLQT